MEDRCRKWVLITGGNGGIGKELVNTFLSNGYKVISADIKHSIESNIDNLTYLKLDLNKIALSEKYSAGIYKKIMQITSNIGLFALINNAAIQIIESTQVLSREQWQKTFNVNTTAPFFLTQLFMKELTENEGAVVNISSIHATQSKKKFVAYASSKATLSAITRNMAIELGSKIRINAIEPAAIDTDMLKSGFKGKEKQFEQLCRFHPQGRIGIPKEVADLSLFLCSSQSQFIQGECISISGGIKNCLKDPDE